MANKFVKLSKGESVASSGGRRFRKLLTELPVLEQLPSPYLVTIDGDYLTWGDYSILATSFDILVDGVVKATVSAPTNSFDLSTLGLADGTYSITVVSKAGGYANSDPSEAVTYTVASDALAGTWVWKNTITKNSSYSMSGSQYLVFYCNGTRYAYLHFSNYSSYSSPHLSYGVTNSSSGALKVYDRSSGWLSTSYKTIKVETKYSDSYAGTLKYLQDNATKQ